MLCEYITEAAMIFSQFQPVPNDMLGTVLVAIAALLGLALVVKNLFFNKPLAEQNVNRTEFEAIRLKADKVDRESATKIELENLRARIEKVQTECINKEQYNELKTLCATKDSLISCQKDITELKQYVHERHHKLGNDMNLLCLNMEKLHRELEAMHAKTKEEIFKEMSTNSKNIEKIILILAQNRNTGPAAIGIVETKAS